MWGLKASGSKSSRRKSSELAAALLAAAVLSNAANAAEVFGVTTPSRVTGIIQTTAGSYVQLGDEDFQLVPCETPEGLCLSSAPLDNGRIEAPRDALPDGYIAIAADGDIRNAWYTQPTRRYAHGVLGDAIEAGGLKIVTQSGNRLEFTLPETQVFEDITPRIRDLDGDGTNEVVAIRSSQTGGAALAIFGLRDDELVELASSSENGQANRWLNVAGILDKPGGGATVYAIRTPHIGGRLFSIEWDGAKLTEKNDIVSDVSNHVIGSRELGLSVVADLGEASSELILLSQDRTRLRFPLSDRPDLDLGVTIDKALIALQGRIVTATDDGLLLIILP
jgi:hypothetical protein